MINISLILKIDKRNNVANIGYIQSNTALRLTALFLSSSIGTFLLSLVPTLSSSFSHSLSFLLTTLASSLVPSLSLSLV